LSALESNPQTEAEFRAAADELEAEAEQLLGNDWGQRYLRCWAAAWRRAADRRQGGLSAPWTAYPGPDGVAELAWLREHWVPDPVLALWLEHWRRSNEAKQSTEEVHDDAV
jgi:hypothetical protein